MISRKSEASGSSRFPPSIRTPLRLNRENATRATGILRPWGWGKVFFRWKKENGFSGPHTIQKLQVWVFLLRWTVLSIHRANRFRPIPAPEQGRSMEKKLRRSCRWRRAWDVTAVMKTGSIRISVPARSVLRRRPVCRACDDFADFFQTVFLPKGPLCESIHDSDLSPWVQGSSSFRHEGLFRLPFLS